MSEARPRSPEVETARRCADGRADEAQALARAAAAAKPDDPPHAPPAAALDAKDR